MITLDQLVACNIQPTQARLFLDPLNAACDRFLIDSPARRAAFIAQLGHESADFTRLEENCRYSSPERIMRVFASSVPDLATAQKLVNRPKDLANWVYANRIGNGDFASGEGWKYRGRGLIQLTGCANYMVAGSALGHPYKDHPELVSHPIDACMTAGWYWHERNLNDLADASLIDAITKKINPGMAGADDREQRFYRAVNAFRLESTV